MIKNKKEANDKLRAWITKNAPDAKIPEVVVPPVVVPPVVVVVPGDDGDKTITNPTKPGSDSDPGSNDTTPQNETKKLIEPVDFAYSFKYLEYIS